MPPPCSLSLPPTSTPSNAIPSWPPPRKKVLVRLGYTNVQLRVGDGASGWPQAAPFEAIIVAASGPSVPDSLMRQLAIGGRLVVPIGGTRRQSLRKVIRIADDEFSEEDLGSVQFVPLVGQEGWTEDE